MKSMRFVLSYMLVALLGYSIQSQADDIDIYSQPTGSVYNPNILIVLDNSANWSRQSQQWPGGIQQGQAEVDAIKTVINGLGITGPNINIGLMEYGSQYAGYIRYAVKPMTTSNVANFSTQLTTIYNNITSSSEKVPSSNYYGDLMYDAYNYYAGLAPVTPGSSGVASNPDAAGYTSTGYNQFLSPISSATSCAHNFIIFIGNPAAHGPTADTSTNSCALAGLNGTTCTGGTFQPQLGLPNFTSTSTTTNTTLGNTAQCQTSTYNPNTDPQYATQCAGYSNGCTATSLPNTPPAACPSGSLSYSVIGTTNAQSSATVTYNISASSMGTVSGSLADWTITTTTALTIPANTAVTIASCPTKSNQSLNATYTISTAVSNSTTFHVSANKNAPTCSSANAATVSFVTPTIAASTTDLGYTSSCYSSQSACQTTDYTAQCSSYTGGCACSTPTATTTPSCATGTNLYQVVGTSVFTTNTPTGTSTIDTATYNADEWAKFLSSKGVPVSGSSNATVTTYTIDVYNAQPNATDTALYLSMADNSGGKYFSATNEQSIVNALKKILNEIQAVNSVFSSASLPISVNAQGKYLNQIYLGMFRPDPQANPRWFGNLKQYQFTIDPATGALVLSDSSGASAINSSTGFISPNATSFWTYLTPGTLPDSMGGFWINYPSMATSAGGYFDSPDGNWVEKGAVAQQIRGTNLTNQYPTSAATPSTTDSRSLYTYCPSGTGCNADLTNAANAFKANNTAFTAAMFGGTVTDATSLLNEINWIRGDDNHGDENGPGSPVTIRPSVHGDVLHSRPLVINYGGSTGTIVFYGDNGGVFHAVNGNQTNPSGSSLPAPGNELWGFIPAEFYSQFDRLRTNSPQLLFPSTPSGITPTPTKKNYFVDGSIGVYQLNDASGNVLKVYLYLSMRRGGKFIYALDVTNPNTPKVLWKVSPSSTGMSELGQTWSLPKVAQVNGYSNPVVIFGGGYDKNEDSSPPTADTSGRGIFVLDAVTGNLVWSATYGTSSACSTGTSTSGSCTVSGMNYSIPADITLMDFDADGYVDRLYAGDTGGNIWRVDLEPNGGNTPNKWQVNKLAALGCNTGPCASGTTPRKFLFPPEIAKVPTAAIPYTAVIAGSGDREHPLSVNSGISTFDQLYLLVDSKYSNDATGMIPITANQLYDDTATPLCFVNGVYTQGCTPYWDDTASTSLYGYKISLCGSSGYTVTGCSGTTSGEKVVNAPALIAGVVYIGTNEPPASSGNTCTTGLGTARGYQLAPFSGNYGFNIFAGGGLPPTVIAGLVEIGNKSVPFIIGGGSPLSILGSVPPCTSSDCSSIIGGGKPPISVSTQRQRTYWYQEGK